MYKAEDTAPRLGLLTKKTCLGYGSGECFGAVQIYMPEVVLRASVSFRSRSSEIKHCLVRLSTSSWPMSGVSRSREQNTVYINETGDGPWYLQTYTCVSVNRCEDIRVWWILFFIIVYCSYYYYYLLLLIAAEHRPLSTPPIPLIAAQTRHTKGKTKTPTKTGN